MGLIRKFAQRPYSMRFSVSSSDLQKKLSLASGAISSNPVLPILEDFLFKVEGNQLTIAATDLEVSVITTLEVNADGNGIVAVPARILVDTLKALPQQPITFTVDEDNFSVEITSAYGKYKLAGEDGEDYPEIPMPDEADELSVSALALQEGISKTLFATSTDELRPAMTGVFFQVDFSKLIMVATDAHKLVKYSLSEVSGEVTSSFIVPKKALNLLKGALPSTDEQVSVRFDKSNAFFAFGDNNIACRLIDARYPDYNAVIPVDNPNELLISRADLQQSLKRIVIYANKTTNQVILTINNSSLTVAAQDLDFSNEATEQLACNYTGDPLTIGFNAKFLVEMLGVLEGEEVKLEMSTATRAGILLPTEQQPNQEVMMLVMPVMLSN